MALKGGAHHKTVKTNVKKGLAAGKSFNKALSEAKQKKRESARKK